MTTKRMAAILATFLLVSAVASPLLSLLQGFVGPSAGVLRLPTFATAIGAAVVWLIWRRAFTFPAQTRHDLVRVVVLSVALAGATTAVLLALNAVEGNPWSPLDPSTLPTSLVAILFLQLLGVAAEEVGWRGVVQPLFEQRFTVVWAGVVTGALFGLGHFHVLLAAGPVVYLAFVLAAIGLSVTLAVLTAGRSFGSRVFVATLFHWLVNSAMLVFFSGGDETLLWTINTAIATGLVAVAAVIGARGERRKRSIPQSPVISSVA